MQDNVPKYLVAAHEFANQNRNTELYKYFGKMIIELGVLENEYTPISQAVRDNNELAVKVLLSNGADINETFKGITPLCESIINNNIHMLMLCLGNGADMKITCNDVVPFQMAANLGRTTIHHVLEMIAQQDNASNQDIDKADDAVTALCKSVIDGDIDLTVDLLFKGADITQTCSGYTASK
ncbi:MAG: ankyrin repeat domain-containing protein [Rickettsiales bacterium]|nr:ankyrin repeat domain-containing protein [Rickettsiales bacterium]